VVGADVERVIPSATRHWRDQSNVLRRGWEVRDVGLVGLVPTTNDQPAVSVVGHLNQAA
jgi:hypothetical protein